MKAFCLLLWRCIAMAAGLGDISMISSQLSQYHGIMTSAFSYLVSCSAINILEKLVFSIENDSFPVEYDPGSV